MLEDKLYTLAEVAKMTRLTDRTLRNYLANGTIKGMKIGGQWRFSKENLKSLFTNEDYYNRRKDLSEGNIKKYIDRKLTFKDKSTGCLLIDLDGYSKDESINLHKQMDNVAKDSDLIEKVSFIDDDGHIRINIISSLDYIKKILKLIK